MSNVAGDFSNASAYTLVSIDSEGKKGTEVVPNHTPGDPSLPGRLMGMGVSIVIVQNITEDVLQGLWQCGMRVYLEAVGTVDDTVNTYRNGFLPEATLDNLET